MQRRDINLLVLAAADGQFLTPVQLQKALFLVGKRMPDSVGPNFYDFEPYHYGPFDKRAYADARDLAGEGLATIQGGHYTCYAATVSGIRRAEEIARSNRALADFVFAVVHWARSLSFEDLVRAIYKDFPEYKENSVFQG